ncbi:hypothetical protein KZZ52_17515 [Dactylosporangium sp. AC04546]|uniref:hypothetical protein n=1 Tax=Dactylosporangium sp. AC04546 TaxID=2862460 RepID=UPI001EDD1674|nr:hypothetical protein [Dactylosporangium sp. AC04546]WVK87097.1 hypothetical protein KZZ52_17515 [Dactylosporangium sp. AC04546]
MRSAIFAGTARHPRLVLGGAVGVAAGLVGVQLLLAPDSDIRHAIPMLLSLLGLASAVLTLAAWLRARPAAFAVDPRTPAFRTLPWPGHVYNATSAAFMSATQVAFQLILPGADQDPAFDNPAWHLRESILIAMCVLLVALSIMLILAAWRNVGVQLRPDGLVDRNPLGTLTVPWGALATHSVPQPRSATTSLLLTYARPDLVRRRGIPFGRRIRTDAVNALFLADAIHHYLVNPQHRQAIGTQAEYEDLLSTLFRRRPV